MSVPQMLACPVKAQGITPEFSTAVKKTEDHFGIVFEGLMKIEKGGLYLLSSATDDGSIFFLDGQKLFDIDRDGGGYKGAWINLAPGYHRIQLQYWENYGGENIEIGLDGEGITYENLPASMLFYE